MRNDKGISYLFGFLFLFFASFSMVAGASVGHWTFDGTPNDDVGSCNFSIGTGVYVSGVFGSGLSYDGSHSAPASVSCGALPTGSSARHLNYRVKIPVSNTGGDGILGYGTNSTGQAFSNLIGSAHINFGGYSADCNTTATVQDGAWHMVTISYNSTNLVVFLDDVQINSCPLSLNTTGTTFYLGTRADASSAIYASYDEMTIGNTACDQTCVDAYWAYTGASATSSTASSTETMIKYMGSIAFGIAIQICLMSFALIGFVYNVMNKRKK